MSKSSRVESSTHWIIFCSPLHRTSSRALKTTSRSALFFALTFREACVWLKSSKEKSSWSSTRSSKLINSWSNSTKETSSSCPTSRGTSRTSLASNASKRPSSNSYKKWPKWLLRGESGWLLSITKWLSLETGALTPWSLQVPNSTPIMKCKLSFRSASNS